jgi:glutathione S-transferase
MEFPLLVALAVLIQYLWFTVRVALGRTKYHVDAPRTTGDDTWERLFRVQQNTLEQLIVFLPALAIFATHLSPVWAGLLGILFLIGRQLYSWEYLSNPRSRATGMAITLLTNVALVIGGAAGLLMKLF